MILKPLQITILYYEAKNSMEEVFIKKEVFIQTKLKHCCKLKIM